MSFKFEFSYEGTTSAERELFTKFLIDFSRLQNTQLVENTGTNYTAEQTYEPLAIFDSVQTFSPQPVPTPLPVLNHEEQEALDRAILFGDDGLGDIDEDSFDEPPALLNTVVPPPPVATPVISTTPAAELDSAGIPWDVRIHSNAKTKTKAGVWRTRKNITEEELNTVMHELRTGTVVNVPKPVVAAPLPPPTVLPPPPPVEPITVEMETPFQTFMKMLNHYHGHGRITTAEILSIIKPYNVLNVPALQARPDLLDPITIAVHNFVKQKEGGANVR